MGLAARARFGSDSASGFAIVALIALAIPTRSEAYPNFIGYGYTSCLVCHFNPLGNGPLTDYGRALGATAISAKPPWDREASDEELGESSGFLMKTRLPAWIRPSADFRGLLLVSDLEKKQSQKRFIPMQADVGLVIREPDNKYYASVTVGYYPTREGAGAEPDPNKPLPLISREHYLAYEVSPQLRLYGGMMDVAYGIRVPDHIAYNRGRAGLGINDQVHGVVAHWSSKDFEAALHPFVGNLFQDSSTRLKGLAAMFEWDAAEKARVGASLMTGTNEYRTRHLGAVHARVGMGEGSAVMGELGFIRQSTEIPSATLSGYAFTQGMVRAVRGLHVLVTGELYSERFFEPDTRLLRFGPSLQYFPLQRLELRVDALATRSLGGELLLDDALSVLLQVHLWL